MFFFVVYFIFREFVVELLENGGLHMRHFVTLGCSDGERKMMRESTNDVVHFRFERKQSENRVYIKKQAKSQLMTVETLTQFQQQHGS